MQVTVVIHFSAKMTREMAEETIRTLENEMLGVRIISVAFVDKPTLLAMTIDEYLTKERWRIVYHGVDGFNRAHNCLMNACDEHKIKTIGEILALGRDTFYKTKNLGRKTLCDIEAVFDHDGLNF